MGKYKVLKTAFDRIFRNDLNANFNEVDVDIKTVQADVIEKNESRISDIKLVDKRVSNIVSQVGNSNTEIVDLRLRPDGTTADTAGDRVREIDAQLAETETRIRNIINIASYPRLTEETNDDGRFTRALAALTDGSILNLEYGVTYDLYSVKIIKKNNIQINFNGSRIHWYGKASANVWGEVGVLSFQGELVDGDLIPYIRSQNTAEHQPPANAPILQSIEQSLSMSMPYSRISKVKTSNNDYFAVGDYMLLMGWTRANRFPYDVNSFEPEIRRLVKVIDKDATYLYVDYFTPWNMTTFVDVPAEKSRALKVIPLHNITINDPKIIDKTTIGTINAPTAQELKEAVSGIATLLVDGLKITNYDLENPKYPALYNMYSQNYKFENLKVKNAQMWGGGQGYAIQNIGCSNGEVKNVYGLKLRHIVDYSWSDSACTENAKGTYCYASDIAIHGICEHDLSFKNCDGIATLGHGIEYFPVIMGDIQFDKCNIRLQVDVNAYTESIYCKDSNVEYYDIPYSKYTTLDNCKVNAVLSIAPTTIKKRGLVFEATMEFKNSSLSFTNTDLNTARFTGFFEVDNIIIDSTNLTCNFDPLIYTNSFELNLRQAKKIKLSGIDLNQIKFTFQQTDKDLQIDLINCDLSYISQNALTIIELGRVVSQNSDFIINVFRNTVHANGANGNVKLAYLQTAYFTGCTVLMDIKDNKFLGTATHAIHFINELGSSATIFDRNNVIKFNTSGSAFSASQNLIINS